VLLPEGVVDRVHLEGGAERRIEAAFGKVDRAEEQIDSAPFLVHRCRMERTGNLEKIIRAKFFRQKGTEREPVREWLKELDPEDRRRIGIDIATCEYGWPQGMPVCRPLKNGLFEVRTTLPGRIARVVFCIEDATMYLLHGFIKKDEKILESDLNLAQERRKILRGEKE
jgi:phage-related protein